MDGFEVLLQRVAVALSRLLDPVDGALQQLGLSLRSQMDALGIPFNWQGTVLTLVWLLILGMVVRTLTGWWRLGAVVIALLVLAKVYGMLPGN